MVAVERIRLECLSEDDVNQLMRDVDAVKTWSRPHPSIVKYEGMTGDSDTLNIVLWVSASVSCIYESSPLLLDMQEQLTCSNSQALRKTQWEAGHKLSHKYPQRLASKRCRSLRSKLKAANILTANTVTANVKLSDFHVSLNLFKIGHEVKNDVTGMPNWSECNSIVIQWHWK